MIGEALREAYGPDPPSLTCAALRWIYHHSKLQVTARRNLRPGMGQTGQRVEREVGWLEASPLSLDSRSH